MNKNNIKNAPGLKFIFLLFLFFFIIILFYIYWYFLITKTSLSQLEEYKNNLKNKNIEISWSQIIQNGFPYRIENNIKNFQIKFNNITIESDSVKLINQPWNSKHFIFKVEKNILINGIDKKINLSNDNLRGSLVIMKDLTKRLSLQSNLLKLQYEKHELVIKSPEFYFRDTSSKNNEIVFYSSKLEFPDINNLILTDIKVYATILNTINLNTNDIKRWLIHEGGIDINQITLLINKEPVKFNGFVSLDKNFNVLSSMSLKGKGIENIVSILKDRKLITDKTYSASRVIIKTIEVSSKLVDKEPAYSINLQNGFLSFMNIQLLKIPDIKDIINY